MPTITVDTTPYDVDNLSNGAKAKLVSLQFYDQELARLHPQAAAMQTARIAYSSNLKELLPRSFS